jgi:hypothetical protein
LPFSVTLGIVPTVEIRLAPTVAYGMTFPVGLRLMMSAPTRAPMLPARPRWPSDLASTGSSVAIRPGNGVVIPTWLPDGKAIVFDRSRENSDIVLIDLPK